MTVFIFFLNNSFKNEFVLASPRYLAGTNTLRNHYHPNSRIEIIWCWVIHSPCESRSISDSPLFQTCSPLGSQPKIQDSLVYILLFKSTGQINCGILIVFRLLSFVSYYALLKPIQKMNILKNDFLCTYGYFCGVYTKKWNSWGIVYKHLQHYCLITRQSDCIHLWTL